MSFQSPRIAIPRYKAHRKFTAGDFTVRKVISSVQRLGSPQFLTTSTAALLAPHK